MTPRHPDYSDEHKDAIRAKITEAELYELLVGPTSGHNAQRLAAYAFGNGWAFDTANESRPGRYITPGLDR